MRLYLVRHADSVPGVPDALRPLSELGRGQARELAARLEREGARAAIVLTSPLLRARETAELVANGVGAPVEVDERLAPGATAAGVREAVEARGDLVVAIGHQPDCGRIAAELSGGPEPSFAPCDLVKLTLET